MTLQARRSRPPRFTFGAAVLVLGIAILAACDPSRREVISLPPTPSISGNLGWILVKEAYAPVMAGASEALKELGHLRDGSILEVEARDYGPAGDGSTILWYRINSQAAEGWVSSREVEVFSSKLQAESRGGSGK
ncbi:MAG: hypothetical protein WCQ50_13160 [Spirochaetota bacterium]